MRSLVLALLLSLLLSGISKAQEAPESFWDDVEVNFGMGVNNFHGDYDALNGATFDNRGVPYPVEGMHFRFTGAKPLGLIESPVFNFKTHLGLDLIAHRSDPVSTNLPLTADAQIVPLNLKNNAYGVSWGTSMEYAITNSWSIEPMFEVSYRLHEPQTDGFVNFAAEIVTNRLSNVNGPPPYDLRDFPSTRTTAEEDAVPRGIPSGTAALKINKNFLGSYNWFLKYGYTYFANDYFDNTSEAAATGKGTELNDALTTFTMGLTYPIDKEMRRSEENPRDDDRIDRERAGKIERIHNIANLITTEEDLRELRRIMSDKILLYDTPGVRFNELAAETRKRRIPLGDGDIETEMIEVPGDSYIMGLTSVDELNIQMQGRKRITINSFLIDKYEVTNRQYRAFLIAMGAIEPPEDTEAEDFNYGRTMDMEELLTEAELENYSEHVNPPELESPEDLIPNSEQWNEMDLDDIMPWETYFYDDYYDNYPVVCVNWYQAKLFAAWAGKRLPTESEWEFAARSGISGRVFPWDGLDIQTNTGRYRANFKQGRGVYKEDGHAIMAPVESFIPNDFGLYNVAGNVSEWVFDSYNPSYVVLQNMGTSNFVSPSYNNMQEPRKVHRGGSWQSTKFFIGVGVRNFQNKNLGTPFVGFRTAQSVSRRTE